MARRHTKRIHSILMLHRPVNLAVPIVLFMLALRKADPSWQVMQTEHLYQPCEGSHLISRPEVQLSRS